MFCGKDATVEIVPERVIDNCVYCTPLIKAILRNDYYSVRKIVEQGGDINEKYVPNESSPLHFAICFSSMKTVEYLISHGAIVNNRSNSGDAPLHFAAKNGRLEVVKYLIEKGADVNQLNINKESPLFFAIKNNREKVVELLLEKGAIAQLGNNVSENTPLHYAAEIGNLTIAKHLLYRGANINSQNKYGQTPLYNAAFHGNIEMVDFLLKNNADQHIKLKDDFYDLGYNSGIHHLKGYTPIDIAKILNNNDIVRTLQGYK